MLIGRRTCESFAGAWPQREGEFADKINSMPKFVVSTTLKDPDWHNTTVLDSGDATAEVRKLITLAPPPLPGMTCELCAASVHADDSGNGRAPAAVRRLAEHHAPETGHPAA